MAKTLTKKADELCEKIGRNNFSAYIDDLLPLAKLVRKIAEKIEGDQPESDVLGRVLALAESRADELMKIAGEFTYSGLADYYRYGADCLYDFAATLRKEFNRG